MTMGQSRDSGRTCLSLIHISVDTNFIPMDRDYQLTASDGTLEGNVLTTPRSGGEVTVTAESGGREGSATVHAIATPTDLAIRKDDGTAVTALNAAPGSATQLTATAAYNHISLKADPDAFTWEVTGNIGTIDQMGMFHAATPGTGTITVTAGGRTATVQVTVTNMALQTVEDFEDQSTIFAAEGGRASLSLTNRGDYVRFGRSAAKVDYTLDSYESTEYGTGYVSSLYLNQPLAPAPYTQLSFWVYGDGSGNTLALRYFDGNRADRVLNVATLDFTGWRQVTAELGQEVQEIQSLTISRQADIAVDPVSYTHL